MKITLRHVALYLAIAVATIIAAENFQQDELLLDIAVKAGIYAVGGGMIAAYFLLSTSTWDQLLRWISKRQAMKMRL